MARIFVFYFESDTTKNTLRYRSIRTFLSNLSRWLFMFAKLKWTCLTKSTTHSTGNCKTPINCYTYCHTFLAPSALRPAVYHETVPILPLNAVPFYTHINNLPQHYNIDRGSNFDRTLYRAFLSVYAAVNVTHLHKAFIYFIRS